MLEGEEWLAEPHILLDSSTRSGFSAQEYFRKLGRRPPVRLYVNDTRSALSAVENGIGVCLLGDVPYTDKLVRYLIVPGVAEDRRDAYVITRKKGDGSVPIQGLVELLKQEYS